MATNEESVTITETSPDGTETVVEITTKQTDEDSVDENGDSIIEEVIEALFDVEIPDGDETADGDLVDNEGDTLSNEVLFEETESDAAEFESGDVFGGDDTGVFADITAAGAEPEITTEVEDSIEADQTEFAEAGASGQHADAAREAQEAADEFVAAGDYEAASDAREVAENEAWEAGDNSMLDGSDSVDLEAAAEKQDQAEVFEEQQAINAQAGDYEAAREDASNAANAAEDADFQAGGDDHTGQADAEFDQMDWAVSEESIADDSARSAEAYAAEGDFETAGIYAEDAAEHQEMADNYGDLGEHGSTVGVFDPSADVDTGGTFDAGADTSIDTSIDAPDVDISNDFSTD